MRTNPMASKTDLVVQTTGSETLVYNLKTDKAYCLNETSAEVWNLCDGTRSISEMSAELSKRMNAGIDEDFISLALDQLSSDGLLAGDIEPNERFAGLSRREVIRKVGFASAVALPIVSSLVAPKASMAQSAVGLLAPCVGVGTNGNCNSLTLICTPTFRLLPIIGGPIVSSEPTFDDQCCVNSAGGNVIGSTGCAFALCSDITKCDGTTCIDAPVADPNCTGGSNTCLY